MKTPDAIGDRRTFAALVARLNFPDVTFGRVPLATREAWEEILPRLAPVERRRLLAAAPTQHALLVATPGGQERLAAWQDDGSTLPPMADAELAYYGDDEHLPIVLRALARAPACVRAYVIHDVAILGTGISTRGWTSRATFVDRKGRGRRRLINLSANTDERLVLHEAAHTWHSTTAPDKPTPTAEDEREFVEFATRAGLAGHLEDWRADDELLAESCALAWIAASETPKLDEQETP
jgi:hypothetical protein